MPTDGNDREPSVDSHGPIDKGEADPFQDPTYWEYEGAEDVDVPIPFRVTVRP